MAIQYTSIDRMFAKVQRDYGIDIHEADIIEWTGEALEAIGTIKLYQENVAFIEVSNWSCELPPFFHAIVQVARDTQFDPSRAKMTGLCPKDIDESFIKSSGRNPTTFDPEKVYNPIEICPNGQPMVDYEMAYYRPFYDLQWEYPQWQNSSIQNRFVPVRLSTSSMFKGICCDPEAKQFHNNWRDEYTIINNGIALRFNFQDGMIALSYLKQRLDEETGYPLVPDSEALTEAIGSYIIKKISTRDFYGKKEGSQNLMQKAEMDWQWHCKRAKSQMMMPTVDDLQNILEQRHRLIPIQNRYYSFFGKMNTPERLRFRDLITDQIKYSVVK
jgi:hypothetical protein